ncbi:hypothetical protein [Hymenobacter properus]|uniref:Copper resistance protein CopC n=1 Tax=Hymenobacter properus TaxID=2791026 RepID=A0A931BL85_9BACT|nr:hypothetical protein [Hymenobacter properus]MBF9144362.1 hypothetical protein [Hymenobacter properus]MBR7723180.1 hypothetical protein [Microvirga sp. SRT04]
MKKLLLLLLALLLATGARAHGGEDHGDAAKPSAGPVATTFSVAALSEAFELLLRFEPLKKGEDADMRLFVSDYATNAPIKGARLTVTCPEAADLKFTVSEKSPGAYLVEGTFPADKKYSLAVNIVAGDKADLMLLSGIEVGKLLPVAAAPAPAAAPLIGSWKTVLLLFGAFALGIAATALVMRRRRSAAVPTSTPAVYENHA